jgi:hypothetical protein
VPNDVTNRRDSGRCTGDLLSRGLHDSFLLV